MLALHALACVAGFIAGSSLPLQAEHYTGVVALRPRARRHALAIAFVAAATMFSLVHPGLRARRTAPSTLSAQLDISPLALLLVALLPHALPELFALFLPLAAWIIASRRGALGRAAGRHGRDDAIAVPLLLLAAAIEVYVWPRSWTGLLAILTPVAADRGYYTFIVVAGPDRNRGDPMAGNITEVTDTNFQAEVIESDQPGARRLLGSLVRPVPRRRARSSRRSPPSATTCGSSSSTSTTTSRRPRSSRSSRSRR